jgi:hypothetical protein
MSTISIRIDQPPISGEATLSGYHHIEQYNNPNHHLHPREGIRYYHGHLSHCAQHIYDQYTSQSDCPRNSYFSTALPATAPRGEPSKNSTSRDSTVVESRGNRTRWRDREIARTEEQLIMTTAQMDPVTAALDRFGHSSGYTYKTLSELSGIPASTLCHRKNGRMLIQPTMRLSVCGTAAGRLYETWKLVFQTVSSLIR